MIPSYRRWQDRLPAVLNSAIQTSDKDHVCFSVCVNLRDEGTQRFLGTFDFLGFEHELITENTKEPDLSHYYNLMYDTTRFNTDDVLVSMIGDDMIFRTPGWDTRVLDLVNQYNGIGTFWCNDNYIAQERMCVNGFWARDYVRATEHPFMCPQFKADMIDYVWRKVAKYTHSAHYLHDVVIEHDHSTKKTKSQWDETFRRLAPVQKTCSTKYGKEMAKKYAAEVANVLISKGFVGDSID